MTFHQASKYCYNWLNSQPFVKEESLTDWLLYNVSKNNENVYYKAFTRNEEASNGSDWEWWILTSENSSMYAYRLLVQAKKLKCNGGDNYPVVTYSNKNGTQIDLLLATAKQKNALPLYLYYSCCTPDIIEQCKNINYISDEFLRWCERCTNGCFITSAFELNKSVFSRPRRKILDQELINCSFGISLLDLIFTNSEIPIDLLHELNKHFNRSNNNDNKKNGIVHRYENLPRYVKTILEQKNNDLSWLDKEFYNEVENLSGVVIIDIREK